MKDSQAPSGMAAVIPFYSKMPLVLRCFLLAEPEERPVPEAKMPSYLWKLKKGGRGREHTDGASVLRMSSHPLREVKDTCGVFSSIKPDSHYTKA